MKYTSVLVLSLLCFSASMAQTNFEPGYYVTSSGEKVEGQILNQDRNQNPDRFTFKKNDDSQQSILTMEQVREFSVGDLKYERHTVEVDLQSSTNMRDLSSEKNPVMETKTYFLKVLIEGSVSLYSLVLYDNHKYFFSTPDKDVTQLIYRKYKVSVTTTAENNFYRQQLYLNVNCNESDTYFKGVDYTRRSLTRHFTGYLECKNESFTEYKKTQSGKALHLTPYVGLNNASLEYSNSRFEDEPFGSQSTFTFGVEAEYMLPFNNNKWSFKLGFGYQEYSGSAVLVNNPLNPAANTDYELEYTSIDFSPGIRHYFYLNQSSALYLGGSINWGIPINSYLRTDNIEIEIKANSNFSVSAGWLFKEKYNLFVRYGFKRDIFRNYVYLDSKYTTITVNMGFRIF